MSVGKTIKLNQSILEELDRNARLLNDIRRRKLYVWACGESRHSPNLHPSRPYCRHKETWKTTKTLDGRHQRLNSGYKTERHGERTCRWLWPSSLRNEKEPAQSVGPVDVLASWWPVRLGCYREVAVSTFIRPVQAVLKK